LPRGKSNRQHYYQLANLDSKSVSPKNFSAKVVSYKVRRHDNLSKIAKRFDTDVRHLKRINRFRNPDTLYPGQRIKVPRQEIVNNRVTSKVGKSRNFKLKVDPSKVATKIKSVPIKIAKTVPVGTLKVARNSSENINKNRPAFKPVSFSSDVNSDSTIGTITVDFDETLSHYAEWSLISVRELRRINRIGKKGDISVNDNLHVNFAKTLSVKFDEKRQEYHKAIQEDFFNNYEISKLIIRSVEKGETLWEMRNEHYTIPLWLLSSYNSDKDIHSLSVGEPVVIPIIIPKDKNT
jgi:membrane-bound lytic murein transglycosylase D